MRLKALSEVSPEITRHPKTPRQQKNTRKAEQTNSHPNNSMPTCYGASVPPHTSAIRGKLEGPWGAHGNTRTCLNTTPPSLDTSREITQLPTETVRPNRTSHGKIKARWRKAGILLAEQAMCAGDGMRSKGRYATRASLLFRVR